MALHCSRCHHCFCRLPSLCPTRPRTDGPPGEDGRGRLAGRVRGREQTVLDQVLGLPLSGQAQAGTRRRRALEVGPPDQGGQALGPSGGEAEVEDKAVPSVRGLHPSVESPADGLLLAHRAFEQASPHCKDSLLLTAMAQSYGLRCLTAIGVGSQADLTDLKIQYGSRPNLPKKEEEEEH